MGSYRTIFFAAMMAAASVPGISGAAELATHLFPQMDGDLYRNRACNGDVLQVGYSGRRALAWIVFQNGSTDLSASSGASLTLLTDDVHHSGTLKVFALSEPVTVRENRVGPYQLAFDPEAPVAAVPVAYGNEGRILRVDLGGLLAHGPFYGLVLASTDGLRADFSSKDSDVPPLIEIRYAFAAAADVDQALALGPTAEAAAAEAAASATDAANSAAAAHAAATAISGSETASQASAAAAAASADAAAAGSSAAQSAAQSANAAAASAASAASGMSTAVASAGGHAASAQGFAAAAEASANAAAASAAAIADGGAFPPGTALMTTHPEPPPGFTATGIRINYEAPWTARSAPTIARSEMASGVASGRLYSAGGSTGSGSISMMQVFDPEVGAWTAVPGMPTALRQHSMVESGGNLYVTGGIDNGSNVQGVCLRFDPAAKAWTILAAMPPRWGHASAAADGKIYVFGGYSTMGFAPMAATYVYDIASNTWSAGSSLPTWRAQMQARESGGKIYVLGGTLSPPGGTLLAVNEAFDIASGTWSAAAPMPSARSAFGIVEHQGRLYVLGGEAGEATNTCLQFDPMAGSWLPVNSMLQGRKSFAAGVIGGKAYVSQGSAGANLSTTEEYPMPKTVYLVEKM